MISNDEAKISALIDRIAEVCPMPASAERVLLLAADPSCEIRQVAEAISADPALAAECLRIANSAVFRRARPVDTLGQAVLTLGLAQIHQMASAMALMAAFQTEHELSREFQTASVLSGSLAGFVAGSLSVAPGVGFLAGLLAEVGAMACLAIDGERFTKIFDAAGASWEERAAGETARYGCPSWQLGSRLLRRNELPATICDAVGASITDADIEHDEALPRATVFGRVAASVIVGLGDDDELATIGGALFQLATRLGIPMDDEAAAVALADRALASTEAKLRA
ncbi:MAG: HDOD domain-containing protein [Myxococcales bacterium]|nr:HDOD domain-containing protein [Myxococcales bacterium]